MTMDRDEAIALVEGCFAAIGKQDPDALITHYTEDYVLELPYADPREPVVIEGRDTVHAYLREILATMEMHLRLTGDHWIEPESLLIAEYVCTGRLVESDEPYANRYVGYWYFRDGRVARLREYYNPERPSDEASESGSG